MIADCYRAGLPPLPLPICQAAVAVLCNGMAEPDRSKLLTEIIVIVNSRIGVFERKTIEFLDVTRTPN